LGRLPHHLEVVAKAAHPLGAEDVGQPLLSLLDELADDREDVARSRSPARASLDGPPVWDAIDAAVRLEMADELGHRLLGHLRAIGVPALVAPRERDRLQDGCRPSRQCDRRCWRPVDGDRPARSSPG
jgi:hypothetical protein